MDINEVITALREDYNLRNSLERKNLSVHDELEDEIADLEQSYITSRVIPALEEYAKKLLKDLECEVLLYIFRGSDGFVQVSGEEFCFPNLLNDVVGIMPDGSKVFLNDGPEIEPLKQRAGSIGFSVTFPDGTVIRHHEAKDTLIESLRKIGLERVSRFRGRLFKGYPLVGKIKRTDGTHRWQEKVGDWYIYVNISI